MTCLKYGLVVLNLMIATQVCFSQLSDSTGHKGKPVVQVFGNFDYNASEGAAGKFGFWFGRAHLGYEYLYNNQFSGKIVLDMGRPTSVGEIMVSDSSGNRLDVSNTSKEGSFYTMTLKFASLEWKPGKAVRIEAGGILQNHYITMERFWGYRYLAETFQDRYLRMPSTDLGVIGYFRISEKVTVDAALTNGEGFRFDQDRFGDLKLASGLDYLPVRGLQTRIYYDYLKSKNPEKPAEQQLFSVFAGFRQNEKWRIGAEYNYRKNYLNIPDIDIYGFSVYGSLRLVRRFEGFLRYDKLLSSPDTVQGKVPNFYSDGHAFITGLQYTPVQDIRISLNYQGFRPEDEKLDMSHHLLLSFEFKI